jgi:hypothetical protein
MTPRNVLTIALLALATCALPSACGGSSSETPWPAEPLDLEPGPAGEERVRGNVIDTKKLPDNYSKKKAEDEAKKKQKESDPAPESMKTPAQPATPPETVAPDEAPAPEEPPAEE